MRREEGLFIMRDWKCGGGMEEGMFTVVHADRPLPLPTHANV